MLREIRPSDPFQALFFVGDFINLVVFFLQVFYGTRLVFNMVWEPRMEEQYLLMEKGRQKWENRVLSKQRKMLFSYYQVATVYQRLALVQSIALFWIYQD